MKKLIKFTPLAVLYTIILLLILGIVYDWAFQEGKLYGVKNTKGYFNEAGKFCGVFFHEEHTIMELSC